MAATMPPHPRLVYSWGHVGVGAINLTNGTGDWPIYRVMRRAPPVPEISEGRSKATDTPRSPWVAAELRGKPSRREKVRPPKYMPPERATRVMALRVRY